MIYPENFEQKTGFDQVRKMLDERCISSLGRKWVENMIFTSNYALLVTLLDQTEEFRQMIITHENYPSSGFYDPMHVFERIKLEGAYPEPEELAEIRGSLATIKFLILFLQTKKTDDALKYPSLYKLTENIFIDPLIGKEIDRIIDEKGEVRSNSSSKLAEIRRNRSQLESQALKRINQLFLQARKEGWIDNNTELALRNGRQVIPIPVAFKRKIKGFVHDQSTTGQTVFVEPEDVFETNNEIRQLELDERREIITILKGLADIMRPWLPQLTEAYLFLGKIDFIRAKAILAVELQAQKPRLHPKPFINWIRAKHPLLYLSFKQQKKHVEPLSLELSSPKTIIVISGPNAGGKSVCLKTVGLVQYMLQCGLLVPMEDHSDAGIFQDIMIDIGDEQSIENDLSTYSSHLTNMRQFLKSCTSRSIFLIDEFGAGTEPRMGGAIAEAILIELSKKNSYGVVTTHYANLKILAGKDTRIVNGSMLFDTQNMRPLFRLKTGNPGSSFAFEIARAMGLPGEILKAAEKIAGSGHIDFDRQLQDLELKKMELDNKEKQLRAGDSFLAEIIEKYQKLNDELESRKGEIVKQAKIEAKTILAGSNQIIEKTIKEIKESSADKEKTRTLRENLRAYSKQFNDTDNLISEPGTQKKKKLKQTDTYFKPEIESGPVFAGDFVRIKGQETPGEVIEVMSKEVLVAFGSVQVKISLQKIEKLSKSSIKQNERPVKVKYDFDINEKAAGFNPNLDIRGQRTQEALIRVRQFVDDAIFLGTRNLKVVHGTGDGILRVALRDYLRTIPEVKRAVDEHPDRGGAGCTLIEIESKNTIS